MPGTWGDRVRYLWTGIEDMAEINDGKTYLYDGHYDPVAIAQRKKVVY